MNRRRFVVRAGIGLIALPIVTAAQNPSEVHRIGCLLAFRRTEDSDARSVDPLVARLRDLGWIEGRNLKIEYRAAENQPELYDKFARELVALNVELIVAVTVYGATAAKNATSSIPIVMVNTADPVKFGLVASLARPGGNVTGQALPAIEWGKWLDLAQQLIVGLSRVAVIANPLSPVYADYVEQNAAAAKRLGLRLQMVPVAPAEPLDEAFAAIKREKAGALVVGPDASYVERMKDICSRALTGRLPLIGPNRRAAELGALVGYGYDSRNAWRGVAGYIDRILRGAKPSDLPVEQASKFELVINLKTAKALGLTTPQPLLLRADEVIE